MSDELVETAWRVLRAASPSLLGRASLDREIADADAAQQRGYFLPDEDERLRRSYQCYLKARQALWETLVEIEPTLKDHDLRVFAIASRLLPLRSS